MVHRLCCSSGIFLDQGSNPCPLHWQADSSPLYHQGCPDPILRKELARELETIEEVRTIVQKNQELIILLKTSSPTTLLPKHKPMESFLCKAISVRLIIPVTKEVWVYICALKSTEWLGSSQGSMKSLSEIWRLKESGKPSCVQFHVHPQASPAGAQLENQTPQPAQLSVCCSMNHRCWKRITWCR